MKILALFLALAIAVMGFPVNGIDSKDTTDIDWDTTKRAESSDLDKRSPFSNPFKCLGCYYFIRDCNPFVCRPPCDKKTVKNGLCPGSHPSPPPPPAPTYSNSLSLSTDLGYVGARTTYHRQDRWIGVSQSIEHDRSFSIVVTLSPDINPGSVATITDINMIVSGSGNRVLLPEVVSTPRRTHNGRTLYTRGSGMQTTVFRIPLNLVAELIKENGGSTGVTFTVRYNLDGELK